MVPEEEPSPEQVPDDGVSAGQDDHTGAGRVTGNRPHGGVNAVRGQVRRLGDSDVYRHRFGSRPADEGTQQGSGGAGQGEVIDAAPVRAGKCPLRRP